MISFLLSLPFWWGMNVLARNLEDLFFFQRIANDPELFTASIYQETNLQKIKALKYKVQDLEIKARAAISVEIDKEGHEKLLFEKNSKESRPIASLTKLMTALVVFDLKETYNLQQSIKITKTAVGQEEKYGNLKEGEELSVRSLLYVTLIESSNDAAYALSELIGQEAFVELMNFYVKELNLENTHFWNSTGLEPDDPAGPQNYSTTQDLVKLSKYILEEYPQIFEITNIYSYEVFKPYGSLHHFIPENTNNLLLEIHEIMGGKTGWGPEAGGCLLTVLKDPRRDSYFINVILGAGDRFGEMKRIIEQVNNIPLLK